MITRTGQVAFGYTVLRIFSPVNPAPGTFRRVHAAHATQVPLCRINPSALSEVRTAVPEPRCDDAVGVVVPFSCSMLRLLCDQLGTNPQNQELRGDSS